MTAPGPAPVYADLRTQILTLTPDEVGISPSAEYPTVWGVLMEMGYPRGSATLVVAADKTVSLYFSSGGGVLGAGPLERVWSAAKGVLALAQQDHEALTPTTEFPLPDAGRIKFYMRTFSETLATDADEIDLGEGRHRLSELFHAGHRVITELRLISKES
jgi:hypothetical protein